MEVWAQSGGGEAPGLAQGEDTPGSVLLPPWWPTHQSTDSMHTLSLLSLRHVLQAQRGCTGTGLAPASTPWGRARKASWGS